jgi:hypothetical protein
MNKAMTINIILIITVLILIGLLSWFLIINRADDKFNQIFSKITIALIAAIVLIGFELLVNPVPIERKIKILILRNKDYTNIKEFSNRLMENSDFNNGYSIMSDVEIYSSKYIQELGEKYDPEIIGLDNLEYSFWTWLGKKYAFHWDVEQEYFEGIAGGGGNSKTSTGADKETKVIKYQELQFLLNLNQLMSDHNNGRFNEIHFPKNTTIKIIEETKNKRAYKIENKYYKLSVEMYSIGTSGVAYTTLGKKIMESLGGTDEEWYCDQLIMNLRCSFSSFRKGSPNFLKQKGWILDVINGLEHDFEWNNLKPELEKAYKN